MGGFFRIVGAENHDAFATQVEGVDVGEADVGGAEGFDDIGSGSRAVVEFEGEDIAEGDGHACLLEHLTGAKGFSADDAQDAILCRVGNGHGDELHMGFLQLLEHGDECSAGVLQKDG